jgi:hypothetical protein
MGTDVVVSLVREDWEVELYRQAGASAQGREGIEGAGGLREGVVARCVYG